jgi:hypothetical protein
MKLSRSKKLAHSAVWIFLLAAAIAVAPARAQSAASPEARLKEFYRWYIHELNADRDPRKNRAKIDSFVSARLAKWMRSTMAKGWDADYFIDGQDWDPKWETGIKTSAAKIRGNSATVTVTLSDPAGSSSGWGPHVLHIKMAREKGSWKIDRVNGY